MPIMTLNLINHLLVIFHSFEARIANAISSFKRRKIYLFMKNKHLRCWIICSTGIYHNTLYLLGIFFYLVLFDLGWKLKMTLLWIIPILLYMK